MPASDNNKEGEYFLGEINVRSSTNLEERLIKPSLVDLIPVVGVARCAIVGYKK